MTSLINQKKYTFDFQEIQIFSERLKLRMDQICFYWKKCFMLRGGLLLINLSFDIL